MMGSIGDRGGQRTQSGERDQSPPPTNACRAQRTLEMDEEKGKNLLMK